MTYDLALWDAPASRRTDPFTSRKAEQEITSDGTRARMKAIAFDLVLKHPNHTAAELERLAGETDGAIRKRLNDLRHEGMLCNGPSRKCSVTGRTAQTWGTK